MNPTDVPTLTAIPARVDGGAQAIASTPSPDVPDTTAWMGNCPHRPCLRPPRGHVRRSRSRLPTAPTRGVAVHRLSHAPAQVGCNCTPVRSGESGQPNLC